MAGENQLDSSLTIAKRGQYLWKNIKNILIVFLIGVAFTYGVALSIFKVFAFEQIRAVKKFFISKQQTNISAKMLELINNKFI